MRQQFLPFSIREINIVFYRILLSLLSYCLSSVSAIAKITNYATDI
jgi:hypothetical protein